MAAQCLAQLKAVSALPELREALKNPHPDQQLRGGYEASIKLSIAALERVQAERCE
jgi:hypothetical protein